MIQSNKAIVYKISAGLAFSFMAVSIKMAGNCPISMKLLFRNMIALFISMYALQRSGSRWWGTKQNQLALMTRSLSGTAAMGLYFFAISHMYLADASMLHNLSPFFVTILAVVFLKEKISTYRVVILIIVFVGALFIIKPSFDTNVLPALLALLSAVFSGIAYTMLRYLGSRESTQTIVFYFSFVSTIITLPFAIASGYVPTTEQWLFLVLTGVFAAIGQLCLTTAYKYGNASQVVLYNYVGILFSGFWAFLIWNEIPDAWSLAGICIIIGFSALAVWLDNRVVNPNND